MVKKKTNITEKVMEKIEKEEIKMRPKAYFVLGSLFLGIGLAGATLLAIFFINLVLFRLRVHAPFGYLRFGFPGLRPFLTNFPWAILLLAIGGIAGGIYLLKKYEISYKKSFVGIVIVLITFVFVAGFILDRVGLNRRAQEIKPLHRFYRQQSAGGNWIAGKIVVMEKNLLTVELPDGTEVEVHWDKSTHFPTGANFVIGNHIRAVGEWEDDLFNARGIVKGKRLRPRSERKLSPRLY